MTLLAPTPTERPKRLVDYFESGLNSPICLTW
jgi:hypothetical protein